MVKRQLQKEYLPRVKTTVQHIILKERQDGNALSDDGSWDTLEMRDTLRTLLPHGDLVLDDAFFGQKEVRDFRPCLDMKEFHSSCAQVLKLIRSRDSKDFSSKNKLTEHLQVLNLSKIEAKMKPPLRDFCYFLAHKSLSSKSFLDVHVLARSQEQPHALNNSSFYRSLVM